MPAGSKKWGWFLVALWFLLWGVLAVTSFTFEFANPILGFIALGAGALLLFGKD